MNLALRVYKSDILTNDGMQSIILGKQLKLCFTKITKIDCDDGTNICEYNKNH